LNATLKPGVANSFDSAGHTRDKLGILGPAKAEIF